MFLERDVSVERPDCTLKGTLLVPERIEAAVMLMHGWSTDRRNLMRYGEMLARHGYLVAAFDARGHGETVVKPDMNLMIDDAGAILEMLSGEYGVRKVGMFGWSMGGLVSTIASTRFPSIKVMAVIATGVYPWHDLMGQFRRVTPIPRIVHRAFRRGMGGLNHTSLLTLLQAARRAPNTMEYADRVTVPYLAIHPSDDVLVPLAAAKQLFGKIASRDKQFVVLDATHDIGLTNYDDVAPLILEFFDSRLK